ncbi:MAG TPA: putative baseplate assembly protein [Pyrinomonadaceae bacterium]|nr:putative baseplate assembly protein [Pyrinomonadaceae bacterium]
MQKSKQNPATCDCCEGVEALTPITIFNRPGLDAIAYRAGTHASFFETMQARLSSAAFPQLAALTTRESRDASMALLDAWAMVGDVLTFYQERIANEGYLRTARERRSVLELARLVGYRLKPGLSASVYLAYTLEPTQDSTVIEIGNKAQSLPGPNELPQVFETAEKLIARSSLNLMRTRLTQPQIIQFGFLGQLTLLLKGASLDLKANDRLLLEVTMLQPRQVQRATYRVIEVKAEPELDRTILMLVVEGLAPVFENAPPINEQLFGQAHELVEKYKQLDAFGLSATSKIVGKSLERLQKLSTVANETPTDFVATASNLRAEIETLQSYLSGQYAFASSRGWDNIAAWLSSILTDLSKFDSEIAAFGGPTQPQVSTQPVPAGMPSFVSLFRPFKLPQSVQPNGEARLQRAVTNILSARSEFAARMYGVINPQTAPFIDAVLSNANSVESALPSSKIERLIQFTRAQVLRTKAFIAGHNLPIVRNTANGNNILLPTFSRYLNALDDALFPVDFEDDLSIIALDGVYDQIKVGSRIAVRRPLINADGVITGFNVTNHTVQQATSSQLVFPNIDITFTVTVLTLDTPWLPGAEFSQHFESVALVRNTTVFAENEDLTLADMQLSEDLSFPSSNPVIELDGFYPNLEPGRWTIIAGERVVFDENTKRLINTGVVVSELIMVASVSHEAKVLINNEPEEIAGEKLHTFLRPAQPPAYRYRRSTVKIFGNVVRATHGETRNEVLGSGDGSKALQSFQLLQPPLTYLPAPTPAGTETTLAVRVNDVLWSEADNLFALGPNVRKYITKTNDEGKTTVIFGDGEHGSRPPTGAENIKAVYRQGIGKGGNVKADQIKLPLTKPLGVKGVINPLPASGGVDKETRDQARRNAPIAVLALDRLVSVQDYADFARTFAGIAKASAQELSDGEREVVHLTIAGAGNIQIDVTSDLYRNLLAALARFGDPLQPLQVKSFERVLLVISAKVNVLPEYLWEKVKEQMRTLLFERLGFENRELGQSVTLSEVLSLMQSVPGVNFVDFDILDSVSEETLADPNFGAKLTRKPRVNAKLARMSTTRDGILPAQLVFLSRDAVDTLILEEVTV